MRLLPAPVVSRRDHLEAAIHAMLQVYLLVQEPPVFHCTADFLSQESLYTPETDTKLKKGGHTSVTYYNPSHTCVLQYAPC